MNIIKPLEERMNDGRIKPDEPETWRGELVSLGVQYGIPGTLITKLILILHLVT